MSMVCLIRSKMRILQLVKERMKRAILDLCLTSAKALKVLILAKRLTGQKAEVVSVSKFRPP